MDLMKVFGTKSTPYCTGKSKGGRGEARRGQVGGEEGGNERRGIEGGRERGEEMVEQREVKKEGVVGGGVKEAEGEGGMMLLQAGKEEVVIGEHQGAFGLGREGGWGEGGKTLRNAPFEEAISTSSP